MGLFYKPVPKYNLAMVVI